MGDKLHYENQSNEFEVINGSVYKPNSETESLRLYIARTLIREVLYLTHSHMVAGHPGIQKIKGISKKKLFLAWVF